MGRRMGGSEGEDEDEKMKMTESTKRKERKSGHKERRCMQD